MPRDLFSEIAIFLASATANGVSTVFQSKHWRHLEAVINASSMAGADAFTIKAMGAVAKTGVAPDFAVAASKTNPWYYLQIVDKNTGTGYDGNTGITFVADETRAIEINTFGEDFVALEISGVNGAVVIDSWGRFYGN